MATDSIPDFPRLGVSLQFRPDGSLTIYTATGQAVALNKPIVDALREYFTRPKALTPRERAEQMVRSFARSYGGFDPVPGHVWINLTDSVAAAIEDAARRGVDWTEE